MIEKLGISPAPWTWEKDDYIGHETATVYGNDGDGVALIRGNLAYDALPENNARLIAAAPELLEAVIQMQLYIQDGTWDDVIKKATGKTLEEIKELLDV